MDFPDFEFLVERAAEELTGLGSRYALLVYIITLELLGEKVTSRIIILAGIINSVVVVAMKEVVARPRPGGGEAFMTASFPSGHTAMAFMVAGVLGYRYPVLKYWLLFLAGIVASTRVIIGAHYISDVVVGAAIGYIIGFAVTKYSESFMEERFG